MLEFDHSQAAAQLTWIAALSAIRPIVMLYDPVAYDRTLSIGSYWETTAAPVEVPRLHQSQSCEVAIIGGGYTGLSTALHLARDHHVQVALLEAGRPGWGASGRNGGFCCIGATWLEPETLLERFGPLETRRYYEAQRAAVELVHDLATAEDIDLEAQGDGEIQVAHRPSRWALLMAKQEFLKTMATYPCSLWTPAELADRGFRSPDVHGALHVGVGFGLNPLKYSYGLTRSTLKRGVTLYGHSPVVAWEKQGNCHLLHTPGGTLSAKTVVIATNGYTDEQLHRSLKGCLLPVISQIITTRPLTAAELDAQGWQTETPIFDTRHLLFYYRLLKDGRLLFGSRGGTRGTGSERDRYRRWMSRRFGELFPAWKTIEITHAWTGFICASAAFTPHLGRLADDPSVFYALAYHGNGVATATWSGQAIAQLIAGKLQDADLCAVVRPTLKRFPLPALRIAYLRSARLVYGIQDRLP